MGLDPSTADALRTRVAEAEAAWMAAKDEETRLRQELIVLKDRLATTAAAEAGWTVGDTYTMGGTHAYQVDSFRLITYRDGGERLYLLGWPLTKVGKRTTARGEFHRQHDALSPATVKVVVQP